MPTIEELHLCHSAQIALLGMITQDIRAISISLDPQSMSLCFRVHFESAPHEVVLENMSCVLTELESGLPFRLSKIEEEYIVLPSPTKPDYLNIALYARCESPDFLPPPA